MVPVHSFEFNMGKVTAQSLRDGEYKIKETIINHVHTKTLLWDKSNSDYCKSHIVNNAWLEILRLLVDEYGNDGLKAAKLATVEDLKAAWQTIRKNHRVQANKVKVLPSGSGLHDVVNTGKWLFFSQLEFLRQKEVSVPTQHSSQFQIQVYEDLSPSTTNGLSNADNEGGPTDAGNSDFSLESNDDLDYFPPQRQGPAGDAPGFSTLSEEESPQSQSTPAPSVGAAKRKTSHIFQPPTQKSLWDPKTARKKRKVSEKDRKKQTEKEDRDMEISRHQALLTTLGSLNATTPQSVPNKEEENEDELFCRYLSTQLKKIEGTYKATLHNDILKLVQEVSSTQHVN